MTVAATLFTGCSLEDAVNEENFSSESSQSSGGDSYDDSLTVPKTNEGFLVMWTKRSGTYGEIIYTDDLSEKRGNGYPLTANADGTFAMPCYLEDSNDDGAWYSCEPSNVTYEKRVYLKNGVSYSWLVSYGTEHEHGEVEAITQYSDGFLTVE